MNSLWLNLEFGYFYFKNEAFCISVFRLKQKKILLNSISKNENVEKKALNTQNNKHSQTKSYIKFRTKEIKNRLGFDFMSDEDFSTYLKLNIKEEEDFLIKKFTPNWKQLKLQKSLAFI